MWSGIFAEQYQTLKNLNISHQIEKTIKTKNIHATSGSDQFFSCFTNQWSKTSSNPAPQSGSNLLPPTPRTNSSMVAALMSGWMAVSCPPRRSCVMQGWHTLKKKGKKDCRWACTPRQPSAPKLFLWETAPPLHKPLWNCLYTYHGYS